MAFDKNTSKLSLSRSKRQRKAQQLQSNEQSSETVNDVVPAVENTTIEQKVSKLSLSKMKKESKAQQLQLNEQCPETINDVVPAVINDSDEVASTSPVEDTSTTKPKITAPNPCLRELISQCLVDRLLEFVVKKNDILGIISSDESASNSIENILSNLMGTSDYFLNKPSFKEIVGELLQLVFEICKEMEDKQLDIESFQTNDDFRKLVLARVALFR